MKKKRVIKRNLNRLMSTWKQYAIQKTLDIENLSKLESALIEYRTIKVNFDETIEELFLMADESDPKFAQFEKELLSHQDEISDFLHLCEGKVRVFHKLLFTEESRRSLVAPLSSPKSSFVSNSSPKLEKIKVPTFNGQILEWLNFKGLLENLVHNNNELSNVQKLHYLKEAMVDEARVLLRDFDLKEESYAPAYSFLLSKFDNPRSIVRAQFRKLHDLEPIKDESHIRQLLNQVDVIVNGLRSADERVDSLFSRYLTYHVTRRLDIKTAKDVDNALTTSKSFPVYDQLQRFLQTRILILKIEQPILR